MEAKAVLTDAKGALKDRWVLAIVIVGVLGLLWSFAMGSAMLEETSTMTQEERQFAALMGQGAMVLELEKLERASNLMRLGALAAVVGLVLVLMGRLAPGGWVLIGAGAVPPLFFMTALMGTFLLLAAGGLALYADRQRKAPPQPA